MTFDPEWEDAIIEDPVPERKPKPVPVKSSAPAPADLVSAEIEDNPGDLIEVEGADYERLVIDNVEFPRLAAARIRAMSPTERADWDRDRLRARTDMIFLASVLGLDLTDDPHRVLFHNLLTLRGPDFPFADLDSIRRKLVLWPRGIGKTSAIRVLMVGLLITYNNLRICFLTGGSELAKNQLLAVKTFFESPTKQFEELFPEFCLKSVFNRKTHAWEDRHLPMGTSQRFSTPARNTHIYAEPNFMISTPKSVKSGAHFDILIIDDLVNDQNYQNASALEKSYQQYLDTVPLLEHSGFILMTGTVYSYRDCYARIQEQEIAHSLGVWAFSIHDCWSQGTCKTCGMSAIFHEWSTNAVQPAGITACGCNCPGFVGDGVRGCLFPLTKKKDGTPFGHTLDSLNRIRAELGPHKFANQYECRITAEGEQTFTEALIGSCTLHHENQLPIYGIAPVYICGDLAYSTSEARDESVIFAFSKYLGALYVWGCWFGRWSASERVDNILNILLRVRPVSAFFEKNLNSDSLELNLIAYASKYGLQKLPLVWTPLSNQKDAKNIRIGDIEAAMKGKRLFLYSQMPGYDRLCAQLLKHPRNSHDDFADALSQCLTAETGWQREALPVQPNPNDWLKRLNAAVPPEVGPDENDGTRVCMD